VIEQSERLNQIQGLRHAFSTRRGGVSSAPFHSLNLGLDLGDTLESVAENRRRLLDASAMVSAAELVEVHQVHQATVLTVDRPPSSRRDADGLITATPRLPIGVRTADCAPVLIAHAPDDHADMIAAVHAGWRGATAGIVPHAVETMVHAGCALDRLVVAIGPAIGRDAFEVGEEVISASQACLQDRAVPARQIDGRWHLDLRELIRLQLRHIGISDEQIDTVGGCTASDATRYFSHRRDRGRTGRHLSIIGLWT
jgi:polyphenol oxidase